MYKDWGNLVGNLVQTPLGVPINWVNGTSWAQTQLPTSWWFGPQACGVSQSEDQLIVANEHGAQLRVIFAGANQVIALDWGEEPWPTGDPTQTPRSPPPTIGGERPPRRVPPRARAGGGAAHGLAAT
jgi:hypothetical protein